MKLSRRRFIAITAGTAAAGLAPVQAMSAVSARWTGTAPPGRDRSRGRRARQRRRRAGRCALAQHSGLRHVPAQFRARMILRPNAFWKDSADDPAAMVRKPKRELKSVAVSALR